MIKLQSHLCVRLARLIGISILAIGASVHSQDRPAGLISVADAASRLNRLARGCHVSPIAVELVNAADGGQFQAMPNQWVEAFFPVSSCKRTGLDKHLAFIGLYTGRKIHVPPYGNYSDHPGSRGAFDRPYAFGDLKGRKLVARPWCCNPNSLVNSENTWLSAIENEAQERVLLFSREEMIDAYGEPYRMCLPVRVPTVALAEDRRTALWIRFFSAKPDKPIPQTPCSANGEGLTVDGARVGSLIEGTHLMIGMDKLIAVHYRSGELATPLPPYVKAPRMEELLTFRDEFRRTQKCPDADPRLKTTAKQHLLDCQFLLKELYENALVDHFFGK